MPHIVQLFFSITKCRDALGHEEKVDGHALLNIDISTVPVKICEDLRCRESSRPAEDTIRTEAVVRQEGKETQLVK